MLLISTYIEGKTTALQVLERFDSDFSSLEAFLFIFSFTRPDSEVEDGSSMKSSDSYLHKSGNIEDVESTK